MKIVVHDSSDISILGFTEPEFLIEVDDDGQFSAMEMFAASIGLCVLSVFYTYGQQLDASLDDVSARVKLSYADEPYRVDKIEVSVVWPALPEGRIEAAERAAAQCTIHNTLHHSPEIHTTVRSGGRGAS